MLLERGGIMKNLVVVAGNRLLDRRAFLRGGAALAAAMTGYTLARPAAAAVYPRRARALSDGVAHDLCRMRRQQRSAVFPRAHPGERAGAARAGILRGMDRGGALRPARGNRGRPQG